MASCLLLSPLLVDGISSLAHLENSGVMRVLGGPPFRTAPWSASLSLVSQGSSPVQGMTSASVYCGFPYSRVSSPSTSKSASLSRFSSPLHVTKPEPQKPPCRRVVARTRFCLHHSYSSKRVLFSCSTSMASSSAMQEPSLCPSACFLRFIFPIRAFSRVCRLARTRKKVYFLPPAGPHAPPAAPGPRHSCWRLL